LRAGRIVRATGFATQRSEAERASAIFDSTPEEAQLPGDTRRRFGAKDMKPAEGIAARRRQGAA
jgi:hypothetical protein